MNNNNSMECSMNIQKILAAKNCKKYCEFLQLNLLTASEQSNFEKEIQKIQGDYFGKIEVLQQLENFICLHAKREWYKMDTQYDILIQEEVAYQKRLASFFIGKKSVASNILWSVPVSIFLGTTHVTEVHGYVNAIVEDDLEEKGHTAYIIVDKKPIYSRYAKTLKNKPEYAPELLGAYLGLSKLFGRKLNVSLVYTRHKDDSITSQFNEKTQLLTVDFSKLSENELQSRLEDALSTNDKQTDCTLCIYESLCNGMNISKITTVMKQSKKISENRETIFTESQNEIINFKEGTCAVYAVPGAGKTTTLVHRLIKLLNNGINPKSILFVTFTNKAADEIRSRIKELLQTEFEEELPNIFTFNGLGWQILRDNREIVGNLKLLTPIDEKRILMECIDAFEEPLDGFSYRFIEGKFGMLPSLLNIFKNLNEDQVREEQVLAEKGKHLVQIKALKKVYEKKIAEEKYINFDQQITMANQLLEEHPDICQNYGKRWNYIMADEYQDSSQDNVNLLYTIANAGNKNIVVVGDTDQSIYEWRNGSPKHLLDFSKHYPGCKQIYMNDNFRSVSQILDVSNQLISKNKNRINMFMVAHKTSKALPYLVKNCSFTGIMEIILLLKNKKYEYGDIAILSRTNAPLAKVKSILDKYEIDSISPSDYLIKDSFFILVKDILDMYFKGFAESDLGFYRYMTACGYEPPLKKNPKKSYYHNLVTYHGMTPICANNMDSLLAYAITEDTDQQENKLYLVFRRLYRLFTQFFHLKNPLQSLHAILESFHISPDTPAVLELMRIIDFQNFIDLEEFWNYLEYMVNLIDERKVEYCSTSEKINLMTAHCSKGKEFPVVIILQAEDFQATEEERRLLYVAMTRAQKCLFVLESPHTESELLKEISDNMHILSLT